MASNVEIVTGSLKGSVIDNAATESTLQEILRVLASTGGGGGGGGGAGGGGGGGANSSLAELGKVAGQTANSLKSIIGTTAGLLSANNSSLSSWTKGLSSAAAGLPVVGKAIGSFGNVLGDGLQILESWNSTLKSLNNTGAAFNNSLFDLRISASNTMMSLDEFASLVKNNSEGFAGMGTSVTQGAMAFSKMSKEFLQIGGLGQQLHEMGMSITDINGGMAKYFSTTLKGTKITDENMSQLSGLYADYAMNLDKLAKMTGQEKTAMEEKMKAVQLDAAWQMKMASLGPEERAKLSKTLQEYTARFGTAGAQYVKDIAVNGQAMQKSSQLMASATPAAANAMEMQVKSAMNSAVSLEQHGAQQRKINIEEIPKTAQALKGLQSNFNAGSAGVGSTSKLLIDTYGHVITETAKFGKDFGEITEEDARIRIESAEEEQKRRNAATQILDAFNVGMKNVSNRLQTSFLEGVNQFVTGLGMSGKDVTEMFKNMEKQINPAIDLIVDSFFSISDILEDYIYPVFTSIGTISSTVVDGLSELIDFLFKGNGLLDDFFESIGLGNITTSKLWNIIKDAGSTFIDLTSSGEAFKNLLGAIGNAFWELIFKIKLAFYEFLDTLPGINYKKEIIETQNAIKDFEREKEANALRANAAARENKERRQKEEDARIKNREARETRLYETRLARDQAEAKKEEKKAAAVPATPSAPLPTGVKGLLEQISRGEGTSDEAARKKGLASGYDVSLGYGAYGGGPKKPLSEMTLAEVKEYQKAMLADPSNKLKSSAVGKYQIISGTLKELQAELGLKETDKFDAATQDKMAQALLKRRGLDKYTSGQISAEKFQLGLAQEWASIADPRTGQGYYAGQRTAHTTDVMAKKAIAGLSDTTPSTAIASAKTDQQQIAQASGVTAGPAIARTSVTEDASTRIRKTKPFAPKDETQTKLAEAETPTQKVTLNDVVTQLETLNKQIAVLASEQRELSRIQTSAIKANNENLFKRA